MKWFSWHKSREELNKFQHVFVAGITLQMLDSQFLVQTADVKVNTTGVTICLLFFLAANFSKVSKNIRTFDTRFSILLKRWCQILKSEEKSHISRQSFSRPFIKLEISFVNLTFRGEQHLWVINEEMQEQQQAELHLRGKINLSFFSFLFSFSIFFSFFLFFV